MKKNQIVIRSAVRKNKIVSKGAQHCLQQGYVKALPAPCLRQGAGKKTQPTSSKQSIKNTAYQGEIGRKVELSKRRKIQTLKKINQGFAKHSYAYSPGGLTTQSSPASVTRLVEQGPALLRWQRLSNNFKKYILYFKKKTWYTDKAAPIPGGNQKLSTGFVRKEKFYKKIFRAYRLFKTYQNFNKKRLKKQCAKSRLNKDSIQFSTIMHMDSLFYSSMRKSRLRHRVPSVWQVDGAALQPCPAQQSQLSLAGQAAYDNQVISKSPYFLNGKYVTKKNFVLYRTNKGLTHRVSARCRQKDGDFCIQSLQLGLRLCQSPTCRACLTSATLGKAWLEVGCLPTSGRAAKHTASLVARQAMIAKGAQVFYIFLLNFIFFFIY